MPNPNEIMRQAEEDWERHLGVIRLPETYGKETRENSLRHLRRLAKLLDKPEPPRYNDPNFIFWLNKNT